MSRARTVSVMIRIPLEKLGLYEEGWRAAGINVEKERSGLAVFFREAAMARAAGCVLRAARKQDREDLSRDKRGWLEPVSGGVMSKCVNVRFNEEEIEIIDKARKGMSRAAYVLGAGETRVLGGKLLPENVRNLAVRLMVERYGWAGAVALG